MMRGHVAIASSPRRRHRARRSRISVVRAVAPPRPHGRNAGHRTKQFTAPPTESPTTHILSRGEKSKRRSIARFNPKVNPNELPPRQSSSSCGSWSTVLTEHTPPLGTIDDMRTARAASLTGMRRRAARVVAGALPSVNLAPPLAPSNATRRWRRSCRTSSRSTPIGASRAHLAREQITHILPTPGLNFVPRSEHPAPLCAVARSVVQPTVSRRHRVMAKTARAPTSGRRASDTPTRTARRPTPIH